MRGRTSTLARPGSLTGRRRDLPAALLFIAPATLGFIAFYVYPAIRGFLMSFTDSQIIAAGDWVGLDNYAHLLSDPLLGNSLIVTVEYVVINIAVQTVLAIALAIALHRLTRSMAVRGIVLLPYMVANVVAALVWFWMLDFQIGIVNEFLRWLGLDPVAFFGSSEWAIPTIALVNVWRHLGYTALLIFAGLQAIPRELDQAASVDGAGPLRSFFSITLPLLRPVLAVVLVVTVTGSFQVFDIVALTTQGGPVNSTRVLYYYIWELAFSRGKLGYASAVSVVLLVLLSVFAAIQLRLLRAGRSDLA